MPWRSGTLDATGTLATSEPGPGCWTICGQGLVRGKGIDLTPLDEYESVAGLFDWAWDARNPKLAFDAQFGDEERSRHVFRGARRLRTTARWF